MSQLLNSYPIFEGNQVLTSTQLNQLVAYLDEQNRVTRAKLIGTGIACGLHVSATSSDLVTITISKGLGVTSQGFLIAQGDCTVNRYKTYTLPSGMNYAPFENPDTKVQDVTLYELLETSYVPIPGETVTPLGSPIGFLNDKVVLLFVECQDVDLKSCLGASCDERGKMRELVIRKLLISKQELVDKVFPRTCSQTGLYPEQYELPEIIIKKVLFTPGAPHSTNYFSFSQNYISSIRATSFVSNSTGVALYDRLFETLRQTYADFAAIFSPIYGGVNPFDAYPDATWTNFLNGSSPGPRYLGMQYFYDFIKDLILAYDEFRDNAMQLISECCTNMNCFPKHLMLGTVYPEALTGPSPYRHYFVLSAAFGNQNQLLDKIIMLFNRMVLMVRKFNLTQVNNPNITPIPPSELGVPVLITPSKEKQGPLSDRSIPYYYKIDEPDIQLNTTLEKNWNYEYIRKYLFAKGLEPLAYGNQSSNQPLDQGPIKTPLYYNTDPYNFMRAEGHIRQSYIPVVEAYNDLKSRFDLPFNLVVLRLAGNPLDDITTRCNFDDLRTMYGTLRTELLCMLQDVFDRFGTKDAKSIQRKPFPEFIQALFVNTNSPGLLASVTQPQTGVVSSVSVDGTTTVTNVPIYAPQRTLAQVATYLFGVTDQMLFSLNSLITNRLPFDLTDFNFGYTGTTPNPTPGFIQDYLNALQNAINVKVAYIQAMDQLIHSSKIRNSQEVYFKLNAYFNEVLNLLERFITDCKYKSLMLLNYTYQYRFQYLKANDQTLFSNFIQKHPGIEHGAGVKPGGTLILVVPGNSVSVDTIGRDFVIEEHRAVKADEISLSFIEEKPFKTVEDIENIKLLRTRIDTYELLKGDLAEGKPFVSVAPVQSIAIQPTQIIADFNLPYLCCCDCECTDIPDVTEESQLNMPIIAQPFYVEYNLGDYAFGQDMFVKGTANGEIEIFVLEALQFDRNLYNQANAKIYLVSKTGIRMNYSFPTERTDASFVDLSPMSTYNTPNDPFNSQQYGTAKIRQVAAFGPRIVYKPRPAGGGLPAFDGIDSFYYMYEILGDNGVVLKRSGMAQITINVIKF